MAAAKIYQIYYDSKSKAALDSAFTPLDNTANERPDWFEFWVIRNFLKSSRLDENQLYGFLSPSFNGKTGLRGSDLLAFLGQVPTEIEVVLFSHGWDQIAYYKNVFEQGEYYHPGLLEASEKFFNEIDYRVDIKSLVGHSMNSVFSNYFVAKPKFWRVWLQLADKLWDVCECTDGAAATLLNSSGLYKSGDQEVSLKVFLQERIVSLLLATQDFVVMNLDLSHRLMANERLFPPGMRTAKLLSVCDTMKLEFAHSRADFFNQAYMQCRSAIGFNDYFNRAPSLWVAPLKF